MRADLAIRLASLVESLPVWWPWPATVLAAVAAGALARRALHAGPPARRDWWES